MTFRVGQKMVCIEGGPCSDGKPFPIKAGTVLTISKVGICTPSVNCVGFDFVEIASPTPPLLFCHCRFRPAVERKTDISIFTKMLTGEPTNA